MSRTFIEILDDMQALHDELENKATRERMFGFFDGVAEAMKQAPTWILCSERLPEFGQKVLTYDGTTCCVEARIPFILDEHGLELYGDWWVSDDVDHEIGWYPGLREGAAIAWMPLPEPFKESENE